MWTASGLQGHVWYVSEPECRAAAHCTMRITAKGSPALVGFPKGSAVELPAAVHDDVLAGRGRCLLVLHGRVKVGLDQRVDPQRQPELIAAAGDRTPDAFLDRGEPVANGPLVDLEQRA